MNRPTPLYDFLNLFDAMAPSSMLPVRVTRAQSQSRGTGLSNGSTMPVDCYATNDHAVVLASMPGIHPDDIAVTVKKDMLTITGSISGDRKRQDENGDPVTWYLSEIQRGQWERHIRLPFPIEEDGVEALFSNGMLRVVLPKVESAKPQQISVQVLDGRFPEIAAKTEEEPESYSAD